MAGADVEGPAPVISGIITGAGGGAVVLVNSIPNPSIIACTEFGICKDAGWSTSVYV